MVSSVLVRSSAQKLKFSRFAPYGCRFYSQRRSNPLRILFCGSDEFSIACLRAIYDYQKEKPDYIRSIDVLCRPGKPAGRSLKKIREVPIKAFAQELGLAVHERDTFTGWTLPNPDHENINLIVAVSFGLFVPRRILQAVEYGGLNVHPSLLPDYAGPAPLQHMLMRQADSCGITLQSLDPDSFDAGKILAQTWFPIERNTLTFKELLDIVTPKAAKLLVRGLKRGVFAPPLREDTHWQHKLPQKLRHASKITSADRKIYWLVESASTDIPARQRALGRLWTSVLIDPTTPKRLVFEDSEKVTLPEIFLTNHKIREEIGNHPPNVVGRSVHFFVEDSELRWPILYVEDGPAVIFRMPVGGLRVRRITVEGEKTRDASTALASLRPGDAWSLRLKDRKGRWSLSTTALEAVPKAVDVEGAHVGPEEAESKAESEVKPSDAEGGSRS